MERRLIKGIQFLLSLNALLPDKHLQAEGHQARHFLGSRGPSDDDAVHISLSHYMPTVGVVPLAVSAHDIFLFRHPWVLVHWGHTASGPCILAKSTPQPLGTVRVVLRGRAVEIVRPLAPAKYSSFVPDTLNLANVHLSFMIPQDQNRNIVS